MGNKSAVLLLLTQCLLSCRTPVENKTNASAAAAVPLIKPIFDLNQTDLDERWFSFSEFFAKRRVAFVRTPAGALYLRAQNCAELARHVDSLRRFRNLPRNKAYTNAAPSQKQEQEACHTVTNAPAWSEIRVDHILPPELAPMMWKFIDDGNDVNSWGLAQFARGITHELKPVLEEEFSYLTSSPQCRPLKLNEGPQTGDLAVIRSVSLQEGHPQFKEIHAATVIDDQLWLTKTGRAPVDLEDSDAILAPLFDTAAPACREPAALGKGHKFVDQCGVILQYYRCQAWDDYLAALPEGSLSAPIETIYDRLSPLSFLAIPFLRYEEEQGDLLKKGGSYFSVAPFAWPEIYLTTDMTKAQQSYMQAMQAEPAMRSQILSPDFEEPAMPPALKKQLKSAFPDNIQAYKQYISQNMIELIKLLRSEQKAPVNAQQRARLHLLWSLYYRVQSLDIILDFRQSDDDDNPINFIPDQELPSSIYRQQTWWEQAASLR